MTINQIITFLLKEEDIHCGMIQIVLFLKCDRSFTGISEHAHVEDRMMIEETVYTWEPLQFGIVKPFAKW